MRKTCAVTLRENDIVRKQVGFKNSKALEHFFRPDSHPLRMKVTRAEVKVSALLAHHNVPIALTDHLSPLFKDIFPDSEIAKAYSCARTKTTCILNGALAKHFRMDLVEHIFTSY